MQLVKIQCDNAPERALHLTGEEEKENFLFRFARWNVRKLLLYFFPTEQTGEKNSCF